MNSSIVSIRVRITLELLVGCVCGFSGMAKVVIPDRASVSALAYRVGVPGQWLQAIYVLIAVAELAIAFCLILRWRVEPALKASLGMSILALGFWIAFDAAKAACGCFGTIPLAPWTKLALIVTILSFSFVTLWSRLPSAQTARSRTAPDRISPRQ